MSDVFQPDPQQPPTIRVVVVEDHPIVRDAIVAALENEADFCVVGQAGDGLSAVQEVLRCQPDVVVMDIFLPAQSGIAAITAIKEQAPHVHILALTSATDETVFLAALQAGATGYLIKDSQRRDLIEAVRQVAQGIRTVTPRMAGALVHRVAEGYVLPEALTERERTILRLIGVGATNHEIAEQLVVGESTVRTHVQHLQQKLGFDNRNQLTLYAVRIGLAEQTE
ncbi:response regulator transcription factor [Caldilinea sp.]|uniref:response regulator transcription factor n=1 Tax=Caldilinea sp. TaxID=2293560 RepID=UPI002BB7E4C2|nr:response regulator transcription factor [Anaerolineales bacterium]HQY91321.1 response regulator transcription factor [Caldilinea sp.]HRA67797.1 response regulator transcription factor [Caldilinea sp.]